MTDFTYTVEYRIMCAKCNHVEIVGQHVISPFHHVPHPALPEGWLKLPVGIMNRQALICDRHVMKVAIDGQEQIVGLGKQQ